MRHCTALLLTAGPGGHRPRDRGAAHRLRGEAPGPRSPHRAGARPWQRGPGGRAARALTRVRTYCTDDGLRQDREAAVEKRRAEVREREAELREARAKGDAGKIAKREAKLAEARRVNAAEAQLQR